MSNVDLVWTRLNCAQVPHYTEWCKEWSYQFLCLLYNNPLLATVGLYIVRYLFCSGLQVHEGWTTVMYPALSIALQWESYMCTTISYVN